MPCSSAWRAYAKGMTRVSPRAALRQSQSAQHSLRTGTIRFACTGAVRRTRVLLGYGWKLRASSYCDGAGS